MSDIEQRLDHLTKRVDELEKQYVMSDQAKNELRKAIDDMHALLHLLQQDFSGVPVKPS